MEDSGLDSTYEGLKQHMGELVVPTIRGLDSTYEGLKHRRWLDQAVEVVRLDSTYEGLKQQMIGVCLDTISEFGQYL